MIQENSRIEKKFVLEESRQDFFERFLLVNNFKKLYPDRVINSIYIDTLGFDFAKDNINGVGVRKKIRFRWYNNDYDKIYIEEKNKRNFNVWKRIRNLTLPKNKKNLINNLKDYLYETSLLSLNNFNYKFVLKTNYKRSYWISNNNKIRATIDIGINACSFNNFFKPLFLNDTVLEFKFSPTHELFFRNFFHARCYNLRGKKYSKYVRSFIELENSGLIN